MGQEASAVGVVAALRDDDLILTNHRSAGHLLARGADQGYVDKDELASWRRRDPIENLRARLVSSGTLTTRDAAAIQRRVAGRLDAAFALAADSPSPSLDQLTTDVYA